ncbi:MAG: hypothetical protein RLZZ584_1658 [Pseudomonadota bacterium]
MMNPTHTPVQAQPARVGQGAHGTPVFDAQALQRLQALDPNGQSHLLARVLKAFEVSLQRLSGQLQLGRAQADLTAVRHVVHTLKSSSASVGALRLAQLCADVETRLRGLPAASSVQGRAAAAPGAGAAAACDERLAMAAASFDMGTVDAVLDEMRRVHAAMPDLLASAAGPATGLPGAVAQAG